MHVGCGLGGPYRYERPVDTQCPTVKIMASNRYCQRIGQFPYTHSPADRHVYPATACTTVRFTFILAYKIPLGEASLEMQGQ
jgi:hypothetical protein